MLRANRQLSSVSEKLKLKEGIKSSDLQLKKQEVLMKKIEKLKVKHSEVKERLVKYKNCFTKDYQKHKNIFA